jgi:hypothetical protein
MFTPWMALRVTLRLLDFGPTVATNLESISV